MQWEIIKEPEELLPIPQSILKTVKSYPENTALQILTPDGEIQKWTYNELASLIISLAREIKAKNIEKGDRVAIYGHYNPEWVITYLAIQFAGAIGVPLDNRLTYREVNHFLNNSGAKILFASEELLSQDIKISKPLKMPKATSKIDDFTLPQLTLDDTALILYTSGTTGSPKGVVLTQRNLSSNVEMLRQTIDFNTKDVFYSLLPLNHVFSQTINILAPFYIGASATLARSLKSKEIKEDCIKTQPTIFPVVPLILEKFIKGIEKEISKLPPVKKVLFGTLNGVGTFLHKVKKGSGSFLYSTIRKQVGLDNLKLLVPGSAALPKWVSEKFEKWGFPLIQGYGLTETSPVVAVNPPNAPKNQSVGLPLLGLDVKILNPGEKGIGEIAVKGDSVFKGFWKNEEATAEVFEGEWFKTGDMGYIDSDGYLYITGRKKSVIVTRGGKNIYPEEIETFLSESPLIEEVLVLYQTSPTQKSKELVAIIYPNYEELDAYCEKQKIKDRDPHKILTEVVKKRNEDLTDFKRIRRVKIRDEEFPKTTTQKIKRYLFEEKGLEV
ncbi:AMP-binding protein [candidate division WOR-3 bacterium]|nr:AMP-binding protein [candidate division WOR-3 bacterium]